MFFQFHAELLQVTNHRTADTAMSATQFKIQGAIQALLEYLLLLQEQNGMGVANGRVPFKNNMELLIVLLIPCSPPCPRPRWNPGSGS